MSSGEPATATGFATSRFPADPLAAPDGTGEHARASRQPWSPCPGSRCPRWRKCGGRTGIMPLSQRIRPGGSRSPPRSRARAPGRRPLLHAHDPAALREPGADPAGLAGHLRHPRHPRDVLGADGVDTYDVEQRHDTSPWATGVIVRPQRPVRASSGCCWSTWSDGPPSTASPGPGLDRLRRLGFYQRCSWVRLETFTPAHGCQMTVLPKHLH